MLAAFGNPRIFKERKRLITMLDKTRCSRGCISKSRLLHRAMSFGDYQKSNGQHRAYDVHVERNTCVAGRKISRNRHLLDMSNGIAEQENGGSTDSRRLEVQIAPKCGHSSR